MQERNSARSEGTGVVTIEECLRASRRSWRTRGRDEMIAAPTSAVGEANRSDHRGMRAARWGKPVDDKAVRSDRWAK